ncbi:MAG: response regulator transcription factor [Desulfuromonadales bacterium]|nr:response regulator transcription factor [Desulfuromonadales bacterium]
MSQIRVLIVDDHPLVRQALHQVLQLQADIDVVGEAADGLEALEQIRHLRPQVLLLDIAMPKMNGLEVLPLAREIFPEMRIIILSMYEKEDFAHQALQAGASGYVLKGAPIDDVVAAVRKVHGGGYYFSSRIHSDLIQSYLQDNRRQLPRGDFALLSERERQVFMQLVEGNSTSQIADTLCVSYKTIEKHRASITRKIGISNPVELVKYAIRLGLIDPELWKS